jgi:hypothetical protein
VETPPSATSTLQTRLSFGASPTACPAAERVSSLGDAKSSLGHAKSSLVLSLTEVSETVWSVGVPFTWRRHSSVCIIVSARAVCVGHWR